MSETKEFVPSIFLTGINTPICATYLVTKPDFLLGQAYDCDAILDFSKEISRFHAQITWNEKTGYSIIDLDSSNKTFVNGHVLAPKVSYPLKPGDKIVFSSYQFQVEQINY